MNSWNHDGFAVRVAVNVSVQDLHDPRFADDVADVLRANEIPASQLTVEITERMLIDDTVRVGQAANAVAGLGIGLSLDDFGTGYASLQQLRTLPLTEVKIDRSYVDGMASNVAKQAIVTSVHQLARALKVDVVAEGVEDEQTAAALGELTGTIGQGYYFGRPMSAQALYDGYQVR
jgi:EAL domain-containing protein (putative c-di-GMP-specific phosphodiesterase class I)